MRAFVLADPALASLAGQFVWLDLNTDLTSNEPALQKHEADALPTFLVVDPKDESVVLRWVGGFTVPQAEAFLEEAREKLRSAAAARPRRLTRRSIAPTGSTASATTRPRPRRTVRRWPRHRPAGRATTARSRRCSTPTSRPRPGTEAVALARETLPRLAGHALGADRRHRRARRRRRAAEGRPGRARGDRRARGRAAQGDRGREAGRGRRRPLGRLPVAARRAQERGRRRGARRVAEEWASVPRAARPPQATTPEARAVFDSHRLSAYLELGQPEKAIPMLEQSAKDLPGDYNPPSRLARAYAADRAVGQGVRGVRQGALARPGPRQAARAHGARGAASRTRATSRARGARTTRRSPSPSRCPRPSGRRSRSSSCGSSARSSRRPHAGGERPSCREVPSRRSQRGGTALVQPRASTTAAKSGASGAGDRPAARRVTGCARRSSTPASSSRRLPNSASNSRSWRALP